MPTASESRVPKLPLTSGPASSGVYATNSGSWVSPSRMSRVRGLYSVYMIFWGVSFFIVAGTSRFTLDILDAEEFLPYSAVLTALLTPFRQGSRNRPLTILDMQVIHR